MSIRTLATREIYRNRWLRLREDQIERSNGAHGIYSVVEKDDCAIIIPLQGDTLYLIEQFRYTIQQRALELPQGGWETADVDPEDLARGELREETGLVAASMTQLGTFWVAYGFARRGCTSSWPPASPRPAPIPIPKRTTWSCVLSRSPNSKRCSSTGPSATTAPSPHGGCTGYGRSGNLDERFGLNAQVEELLLACRSPGDDRTAVIRSSGHL